MVLSEGNCEPFLASIAKSLAEQSDIAWLWLIVCERPLPEFEQDERIQRLASREEADPWLQSKRCAAWIRLETPGVLEDHCALEKVRWCLRSLVRARYVAYVTENTAEYRLQALRRQPSNGIYWSRGPGTVALPSALQCRFGRTALMLLPWLEPGGADRCNLDILRSLVGQGWHVCVVATLEARHAWQARFCELTDDLLVLPHFLGVDAVLEFLLASLQSRRPELLLSSNCRLAYDLLPVIRAAHPQLPVVVLNHMEEAWGGGGYPGLAARAGNAIDRHWTVSDHLRHWLVDHGVEGARVRTLHWFADTLRWAPCRDSRHRFRQRLGIAEEVPVIIYAGRLCRQKRPDIFVRTLSALAEAGQEYVALVAGDGELAPALRRNLQQLGLQQQVHILGWQDEEGLRDAFRASDLLFLPSEGEGIALVLYEAMACGLAVLASDVGGQAELVSKECGRLVAPGDEEAYALALQELLADPRALCQMGKAARSQVLGQFSEAKFSGRLEQLLADLEFKPWLRVPKPFCRPRQALIRLHWQWSLQRLLVRLNQERLASMPLIGRPMSLLLKGALYAVVWGIGMCRLGRSTAP